MFCVFGTKQPATVTPDGCYELCQELCHHLAVNRKKTIEINRLVGPRDTREDIMVDNDDE